MSLPSQTEVYYDIFALLLVPNSSNRKGLKGNPV
ncbi:hypothetical protein B0I27_11729 [Arcticibacter pallidicorallinus]|uniref:Uncharacterized protein n=1 Tax=Arcticibacter pallidicorallinus TaxID=1259464 RepID=A0A2T0TQN4_9SPHI|nr:hypothetical protein B0I27_11729 [Arcticibacter pallidicorallinus]